VSEKNPPNPETEASYAGAETTWADLRENAADMFGAYPPVTVEDLAVEEFRRRPNHLRDVINSVADGYHDGNVRSPWAVVGYRLKQEARRADAATQIRPDTVDEPKRIHSTRTRIRNNIYLHEEIDVARDEIEAELGPHATPDLVDEMLELWRERRLQVGWG
jgi:hypothetical protein